METFGGLVTYFSEEFQEFPSNISRLNRWEKPLFEGTGWLEKLPIDVWVIYSGIPGNSLSIEEIRQADVMEKERL